MPEQPVYPVRAKQGGKEYLLYFNGFSDEEIAEWFEDKHGYPPEEIIRTGSGALAGPIEKKEK